MNATADNPTPRVPGRIIHVQVGPKPPGGPEGEGGDKSIVQPRIRRLSARSGWLSMATESGFRWLMLACSLAILLILALFFRELWVHSRLSLAKFGIRFFSGRTWDPVDGDFGALAFIYGTLVSSFLALLLAVPFAVGVAVFVTELCPRWLRTFISFTVELLAAVPSVIYGFWAFLCFAPCCASTWSRWLAHSFRLDRAV